MKKAFTLIELIIVVIIVGILATLAIPQYTRAVERAKLAKARHALKLLFTAEAAYMAEQGSYRTGNCYIGNMHQFLGESAGIELTDLDNDLDWEYCILASGLNGFTAYAARRSGEYQGCVLGYDSEGLWFFSLGGSKPTPNPHCPSFKL